MGGGEGIIFRAEFNSKKFSLPYSGKLKQHKYSKEIQYFSIQYIVLQNACKGFLELFLSHYCWKKISVLLCVRNFVLIIFPSGMYIS